MPRGRGLGVRTVIAAQAGDARALDSLLAGYLPLIYNIVGRALSGHADVDDVVQETMLRAVRGLSGLRDPAAFRSWLVAVAIRQMREHYRARQAAPVAELGDEVADPAADFVELTIVRLGLSGQRAETAQATRWLDPGDRELLALWWLEAAGELDRGDLVAALGLPASHVAVRVARMKEQLTTSRLVVRALSADPRCVGLAMTVAGWDETASPLWRKRIARHMRDCPHCGAHQRGLIPAERLLAGLVLVPPPAQRRGGQAAGRPGARQPHRAPGRAATVRLRHGQVAARTGGSLPVKLAAAAVAVGCAAAGGAVIVHLRSAHPVAAATQASRAPAPGDRAGHAGAGPAVRAAGADPLPPSQTGPATHAHRGSRGDRRQEGRRRLGVHRRHPGAGASRGRPGTTPGRPRRAWRARPARRSCR